MTADSNVEDSQHSYGDEITITVPERAIGLVLDRAYIEYDECAQLGDARDDFLDDFSGALEAVSEAIENAEQ